MRKYTRKLYLEDLSRKSYQMYLEAIRGDTLELRRLALQRGYLEPDINGGLDPRCKLVLVRPQQQGSTYLVHFKNTTRIAELSEIAQGSYNGDFQRSLSEDIDLITLDFAEEFKRIFLRIPLVSLNLLFGRFVPITSESQKQLRRQMNERGLVYGESAILSLLSEGDSLLEEEVTD